MCYFRVRVFEPIHHQKNERSTENPEVLFQPKSENQKDDCLFCSGSATVEAVCCDSREPSYINRVRCCDNESCKREAAEMARMLSSS